MTDIWQNVTGFWGAPNVLNGDWSEDYAPTEGEAVQIGTNALAGRSAEVIITGGVLGYASGTLVNYGTIAIDAVRPPAAAYPSGLGISGTTVLSGGGTIILSLTGQSGGNFIEGANGYGLLDNVDNTISGAGTIGAIGNTTSILAIINETDGIIDATSSTVALEIDGDFSNSVPTMSLTNDGLLEATGTSTFGLLLYSVIVDQTGGGVTEAAGGNVTLEGTTIIGGKIESSGAGVVKVDSQSTLDGTETGQPVTITSGSTVLLGAGSELILAGTSSAPGSIINNGTIQLKQENYATVLAIGSGADGTVLLSGGGTISFDDGGNNLLDAGAANTTLDNIDNTIEGSGEIGENGEDSNHLTIINEADGIIDATGASVSLHLNNMTVTNDGLMEATGTNAYGLQLDTVTVDQSGGGRIDAVGSTVANTGRVTLSNTTIIGGTLESSGTSGVIDAIATSTLDGTTSPITITAGSTVQDGSGSTLILAGTSTASGSIVNHGTILLGLDNYATALSIGSGPGGKVLLSGGGTVSLADTGNNIIDAGAANTALDNIDNTIEGSGEIGYTGADSNQLTVINEADGIIDATGSSASLHFNGSDTPGMTVTNDGLMEATGTNTDGLQLDTVTVNQSGGGTLDGAGGNVTLSNTTVIGGTLESSGSGVIESIGAATLDATTSPITITTGSTVEAGNGTILTLAGTSTATGSIVNHGTIKVDAINYGTSLNIGTGVGGTVMLSGGGTVALTDTSGSLILAGASNAILDNVDNTIEGAGSIGMQGGHTTPMQLINGGTIEAIYSNYALNVDTGNSVENDGILEGNDATLAVSDAVTGTGSALITAGGTVAFAAAFNENAAFQGAGTLKLAQAYSGTVSGFSTGDNVDLANITYAATDHMALQSTSNGVETFALENASNAVLETFNFLGAYYNSNFEITNNGGKAQITYDSAPCYCPGTLITTDHGDVAVEQLSIGDRLMTASGAYRPIKWIGRRSYAGRFIIGKKDILPVCFQAGSLAENVPARDLWVSPHHAMYLDGLLIEAKDLVDGHAIKQADHVEMVEYFHVELHSHDVIIAEGAFSETFIDDDNRGMFHNAHEYTTLYPNDTFTPSRYCAPRVDSGASFEAAVSRLKAYSGTKEFSAQKEKDVVIRGFVDMLNPFEITGWAQRLDQPDAPVCLGIYAGQELVSEVVAGSYRDDLKKADIGHGFHAFRILLPKDRACDPASIEVRSLLNNRPLPLSDAGRLTRAL